MEDNNPRSYQVTQLGPPKVAGGIQFNIRVTDLESIVTHHPGDNFRGRLQDGRPKHFENLKSRSYAFLGGELQEIEMLRTDEYKVLKPDQVLLIKDFILDDVEQTNSRAVDVPAPVAGYVGGVDKRNGVVDIYDKQDGYVIARVRHLGPIAVSVGDEVAYGESLGTQNRIGLGPKAGKHVHLEMDTRYYQQFENYISDLTSGRLPVQAEHRVGVQPRPVVDDGVMRLGESGERVVSVQHALVADGYRAVGNKPIEMDGVYRPDMQGALIAFQQDHRIPQTGDIDAATYQLALRVNLDRRLGPVPTLREDAPVIDIDVSRQFRNIERGLDPQYTPRPGTPAPDNASPIDPARTGRTPNLHGHPGHDPTPLMETSGPRSPAERKPTADDPEHPDHPMLQQIRGHIRELDRRHGREFDETSERISHSLLTLAKGERFKRVDHVLPSESVPPGAHLFIVQGSLSDPAHLRTVMKTETAAQTPVAESNVQLEQMNLRLAQEQTQAQQLAQQRAHEAPGSPAMRL